MSTGSIFSQYVSLYRRLSDTGLKVVSKLIGYDDATLYRYSVEQTDYKDLTKTLIGTETSVPIYLDFPSDVSHFSSNVTFIEDLLPIIALFPWQHEGSDLGVDIHDEFEVTERDEFGEEKTVRYEITERKSEINEDVAYREFIVVLKRSDSIDLTDSDSTQTGVQPKDENIEVGKEITETIDSNYDF